MNNALLFFSLIICHETTLKEDIKGSVSGSSVTPNFLIAIRQDSLIDSFRITSISEWDDFTYVGTNHGLIVHNKKNAKVRFLTKGRSRLPCNNITSIACKSDGYTYVGTGKGIMVWDNYSFFIVDTQNSNLPDNYITALTVDANENLWVGTRHAGLLRCDKDPFSFFFPNPINPDGCHVHSISSGADGSLWVDFLDGPTTYLQKSVWEILPSPPPASLLRKHKHGKCLLNLYKQGQYYCNGTFLAKLNLDEMNGAITCSYYNPEYKNLILCDRSGIYDYDLDNINDPPHFTSYVDFKKLLHQEFKLELDKIINRK